MIIEILPFEVTSLYGRSFIFINDIGTKSICHEFKCPHLHRGDWTKYRTYLLTLKQT